ncbi:hypothetical protein KAR91_75930 [Candidatus Pacearchaeota archaeon]|nr:hypothetical protein [Candidatus Pacearchaeota archaeon]
MSRSYENRISVTPSVHGGYDISGHIGERPIDHTLVCMDPKNGKSRRIVLHNGNEVHQYGDDIPIPENLGLIDALKHANDVFEEKIVSEAVLYLNRVGAQNALFEMRHNNKKKKDISFVFNSQTHQ